MPIHDLHCELLDHLQAWIGLARLRKKRFEVAGVGIDQVTPSGDGAVKRQVVQFDGKGLGCIANILKTFAGGLG